MTKEFDDGDQPSAIVMKINNLRSVVTAEDREYFNAFGDRILIGVSKVPMDVRELSVYQLEERFRPSYQHYQFKVAFWKVFSEAITNGVKFEISDVIRISRSNGHFFTSIIRDPHKLWWLMSPIATYDQQMEALLYKSMQIKSEILDLPIKEKRFSAGGSEYEVVNTKIVEIKTKIMTEIEDRRVGPVIKSAKIQIEKGGSNAPRLPNAGNIDAEIAKLEGELGDKNIT